MGKTSRLLAFKRNLSWPLGEESQALGRPQVLEKPIRFTALFATPAQGERISAPGVSSTPPTTSGPAKPLAALGLWRTLVSRPDLAEKFPAARKTGRGTRR